MNKVLILQSSEGMNAQLSQAIADGLQQLGVDSEIVSLVALQLPLYTSDTFDIPKNAIDLYHKIERASGVVIVAPEFNGGMPPVLTNAITWISVADENWRAAFDGKAVAFATHSGGGGYHLIMALRQQFSFLGANIVGAQLVTSYQRPLEHDKLTDFIKRLKKSLNPEYNLASMLDDDGHYFEASY